ncbi:MAG: orotate phosphoribosyltransferase [Prevotellamassilia sp.]
MSTLEKIFAEKLLNVKAIKLQPETPFTWASGWKSPFYCDNKDVGIPRFAQFCQARIEPHHLPKYPSRSNCRCCYGAITSLQALGLQRSKQRSMTNLIEGDLQKGMKVVVVEDLISTGGSSLKAVEALRQHGCEVIGMVASYTYGFPVAEKAFADAQVELTTLTNYEAVVEVALQTGYIKQEHVELLHNWRENPAEWGK